MANLTTQIHLLHNHPFSWDPSLYALNSPFTTADESKTFFYLHWSDFVEGRRTGGEVILKKVIAKSRTSQGH